MSVILRWFPQSFVQLRSSTITAYIDPSITTTLIDLLKLALPSHGAGTRLPDGITAGDAVLLTHPHLDHLASGIVGTLSRDGSTVLAPESCRRKLGSRMTPVAPGDRRTVSGIEVEVVEAFNPPGSRMTTYHPRGVGVGYVISIGGLRIYHAGDTGLIDEMRDLGAVDVALLPIGGRFTMDIPEAVEAVQIIRPRIAVPMHFLRADPLEFKRLVEDSEVTEVRVLAPGGSMSLEPGDGDNKV